MARQQYKFRFKPELLTAMKRLHEALRPDLSFNKYIEMKIEEKMIEEQERLVRIIKKREDDPGYLVI